MIELHHDPLFESYRWKAMLRVLEVEEIKSVPYTPESHPFMERLIGTMRREYLDETLFWTATDLQRKLDRFKVYYNDHRVHSELNGKIPSRTIRSSDTRRGKPSTLAWQYHLNGLYQLPFAA